jgi:hypothetical protein
MIGLGLHASFGLGNGKLWGLHDRLLRWFLRRFDQIWRFRLYQIRRLRWLWLLNRLFWFLKREDIVVWDVPWLDGHDPIDQTSHQRVVNCILTGQRAISVDPIVDCLGDHFPVQWAMFSWRRLGLVIHGITPQQFRQMSGGLGGYGGNGGTELSSDRREVKGAASYQH